MSQQILISAESGESTNEDDGVETDASSGFALGGLVGGCGLGFWSWVSRLRRICILVYTEDMHDERGMENWRKWLEGLGGNGMGK